MSSHDEHCFIAVPYGRDDEEHARIDGWVNEVMLPVVSALHLDPWIAALTMAPSAITPEIREHLAFDKLALFDLGGSTADEAPNPNVMYELGIRHAFDLPSVVLAWKDQALPFDISEHRVLRGDRHFGTLASHRQRLEAFGIAALEGDYFRPMHAVRVARMRTEIIETSNDAALVALGEETKIVKGLLSEILSRVTPSPVLAEPKAHIGPALQPWRSPAEDARNAEIYRTIRARATGVQPAPSVSPSASPSTSRSSSPSTSPSASPSSEEADHE
jgi:hypothetical protein